MHAELTIKPEDISIAEKILLQPSNVFDPERREFITRLDTLDLQAVPGSGKTTALLAKLILLERQLPFADGSGILVISHTNAAVDEIKNRIQVHAPKLFSSPNYIGTIQGFVDQFLAVPYYINAIKKKPVRIDNDIFWEQFHNVLPKVSRSALEKRLGNKYYDFISEVFVRDKILVDFATLKPKSIPKIGSGTETHANLLSAKKEVLKRGFLNFNDAYALANSYIDKYPDIVEYMQRRFKYVFIDEMQDMEQHQYDLLEKLFYSGGKAKCILQRIGDRNQSIYNSVDAEADWQNRVKVLNLKGSHRLSAPIASVVNNFALYKDKDFAIVGHNNSQLKPHILLYDDTNFGDLLSCYAKLVSDYKNKGELDDSLYPVKALAWNTNWKDDEEGRQDNCKLRLEDFFKGFSREKIKRSTNHSCLRGYLYFSDITASSAGPSRKNILNALLRILRYQEISDANGRSYSKKRLMQFIKEKDEIGYNSIKRNLYLWSEMLYKGQYEQAWKEIKQYVPDFIAIFSTNPCNAIANAFIDGTIIQSSDSGNSLVPDNYFEKNGVRFEVTSVHSVKGKSLSAVLYIESYYNKDGKGDNAKSYESERLASQFLDKSFSGKEGERVKQSAKMIYVGFSRPTQLLCFAIHKSRFSKYLNLIDKNKWEVMEVELELE